MSPAASVPAQPGAGMGWKGWGLVVLALVLLAGAVAVAQGRFLRFQIEIGMAEEAYGTPQGITYSTPTNSVTGGWTVATVRDIYSDRYSFTAYVPLSSPVTSTNGQSTRSFRTLGGDETADDLVRSQTGFNAFEKNDDGLTTFVLYRPPTPAGTAVPTVPKLDLSVVPGAVLFVNFRCVLPDSTTGRATAPKLQEDKADAAALTNATSTTACLTAPPKQGGLSTAATARYYVQEVGIVSAQPSFARRCWVALLVASSFLALVFGLFWGQPQRGLAHLIVGKDNRYSNSQFQTVTWFFIFFVAFLTTQIFRITYGNLSLAAWISVPSNLLAVSGLSLLTFVGAAIITDSQIKSGEVVKVTAIKPSFPGDLFHNDAGEFDLGDFQSALVSVIAAGGYLFIFLGFLGSLSLKRDVLPDVDGTLLAVFGLAQGAYLAKKASKVSEQKGVALSVLPEALTFDATRPFQTVLSIEWSKKFIGKTLSLSAVRTDQQPYGVTFSSPVVRLDDTLRADVTVTLTNPGARVVDEVIVRGVVDGLVREAKLTVTGA